MRSIVLPIILCFLLLNLFAATQGAEPKWCPKTKTFAGNNCTRLQCLLDFLGDLGASSMPKNCHCTPLGPIQHSCKCDVVCALLA
ncbi:hypothetical protein ACOSP7_009182 [Xanthoceras sorbifolium]|uniref:Uncharacterized protein n=1 Tax=Xanthoceras sorbifolium TaxID=99658 RepID=A0ABQ8HVF9_9ROSI|nr:hypothetical protein JRO89_XS07G0272400 [Xanthoceras sorbifolium]